MSGASIQACRTKARSNNGGAGTRACRVPTHRDAFRFLLLHSAPGRVSTRAGARQDRILAKLGSTPQSAETSLGAAGTSAGTSARAT
jgi:hypothetical protein